MTIEISRFTNELARKIVSRLEADAGRDFSMDAVEDVLVLLEQARGQDLRDSVFFSQESWKRLRELGLSTFTDEQIEQAYEKGHDMGKCALGEHSYVTRKLENTYTISAGPAHEPVVQPFLAMKEPWRGINPRKQRNSK